MVTPRTETERAVFELWKELRPDEAFVFGLDECAGRLFIPTQRRVDRPLGQNSRWPKTAARPLKTKIRAPFRARLRPPETAPPPPTIRATRCRDILKKDVQENPRS